MAQSDKTNVRTSIITIRGSAEYKKAIKAIAASEGFSDMAEFVRFIFDNSKYRDALTNQVKKFQTSGHNSIQSDTDSISQVKA